VVPTPPVPLAPETAGAEAAGNDKVGTGESREIDITKIPRGSRLPCAVLLKRVFMTDAVTCPKCHGRMKILAAIIKPDAICKILEHLGIPSEAPALTAARPPPQAELSGAADLAEIDYADPPSPEWWPISAPKSGARDRPCPPAKIPDVLIRGWVSSSRNQRFD